MLFLAVKPSSIIIITMEGIITSVGAAALAGGASYLFLGGNSITTIFGTISSPLAMALTVGIAAFSISLIETYVMSPETFDSWDESVGGYFDPLLVGAAAIVVPFILVPGMDFDMMSIAKLGVIGASASLVSSMAYDKIWSEDTAEEDAVIASAKANKKAKKRAKKQASAKGINAKVAASSKKYYNEASKPMAEGLSAADMATLGL